MTGRQRQHQQRHQVATGPAAGRRVRAAMVLAACAVVLAGCGLLSGVLHTNDQLRSAGYTDPTINLTGGTYCQCVTVTVSGPEEHASFQGVAGVVWANLPGRFSQLHVTVGHLGTTTYSHPQLVSLFGPRPGTLDQQTVSQELGSAATTTAAVLGLVALVVLMTGFFVILVFVRRRRRQRERQRELMMATLPPAAWSFVAPGYTPAGSDGGGWAEEGPAEPAEPVPPTEAGGTSDGSGASTGEGDGDGQGDGDGDGDGDGQAHGQGSTDPNESGALPAGP